MDTARMQHGSELALWRAQDLRLLLPFVAGSVALHLALAAVLPQLPGSDVPPQPLQVTLDKREPPPVVTPPTPLPLAPAVPRPTEKSKPLVQKRTAPPEPQRPAVASPPPPPVLALPQAPSVPDAPAALTVPQPEEKPAVAARDEKPIETAPESAPRSSAATEQPGAEKTTPPISDAAYLKNPRPLYPISARRRGIEGTVLLKVLVTREGSAASVSVEKSSGSTSLDDAALDAVRNWRFVPARRGAQPVEAWHLVPIVFKLEGTS